MTDFWMEIVSTLSAVGVIAALTGTQYTRLAHRIDKLDEIVVPIDRVRELVSDKLEPHKVTVLNLSAKIDDLRISHKELDAKIDKILDLLHDR